MKKKGKLIIDNPELILTDLYYSQTSSTLLVAFVWVFMVLISLLWNSWVNVFDKPIKSSILDFSSSSFIDTQTKQEDVLWELTIGKQVVKIWWKEYSVEITPKF